MSAQDGDAGLPDPVADVGGEQRRRRLVALVDGDGPAPGPPGLRERLDRVCAVAGAQVAVDGAGVTVLGGRNAGPAGHRDQVAGTGALTRRLDELQLTTGEGPCLDAYASGEPALAGDLTTETTRWLGFAPEAIAAGAVAVFSLPLQVGAARLGTLDMYRTVAGPLSREQLADALVLAVLATEALLELAEQVVPVPGPEADTGRPAVGWLSDVHAHVHVASGMVSARAGIGVDAALLRIRAHAFASGEPISEVARRIIDRDLVLGPGAGHLDAPPSPEP